jgi:uncharacterized protein (TIGR00255 family)
MMSMTGFGRGSAARDGLSVRVELSAVNRKNLDLTFSLPRAYAALEARCQTKIQKALHRGRIQVRVEIERQGGHSGPLLDTDRAAALLEQANTFAASHGLRPVESVSELLPLSLMHASADSTGDDTSEVLASLLDGCLDEALGELTAMRAREGEHLAGVLSEQLDVLEKLLREIEPLIDSAREAVIQKLRESIQALDLDLADAQPRLLQEIALYGERTDIREETDRIQGHILQAREKIQGEGPCGRALDFICQELARELNTLSVKSASSEINRLALAGKEQLEKIREQVQNVE